MMPPAQHGFSIPKPARAGGGFTIIEILTIVAILGILAALLFPLVGRAQQNAKNAKTRVQFSQWSAAIEAFRQEYGFYPSFTGNKVNGTPNQFLELLSGRETTNPQNKKRIPFYSFGNDEVQTANSTVEGKTITVSTIVDAFGNSDITVLVDDDYDGIIEATDINSTSHEVGGFTPPSEKVPSTGVRAGVIFFSAGAGSNDSDVVTSW
ncbi:MAG: type II secretion system protein [Opitutaceae bacterium]